MYYYNLPEINSILSYLIFGVKATLLIVKVAINITYDNIRDCIAWSIIST